MWFFDDLSWVHDAEEQDRANGITSYQVQIDPDAWLDGIPADPHRVPAIPLEALTGWPFLVSATGSLISGPTGGGRSMLVHACGYDAARGGVPVAYLGHEISPDEFDARTGLIADTRGDILTGPVERLRYLDLTDTMKRAWHDPDAWAIGVAKRYQVVIIDPVSAVGTALELNFDQSNTDYVTFYDRLVQPLLKHGVTVVLVDNIGHADDAKNRAKGASAKTDRADLAFACKHAGDGLLIKATKVRQSRAPFKRGQEWTFGRDSQRVELWTGQAAPAHTRRPRGYPTIYMRRVSDTLAAATGPLSLNSVRARTTGKTEHKDAGVRALEAEGYIRNDGDGYRLLRPYRDPSEDGDRDPATPDDPRATPPATPTLGGSTTPRDPPPTKVGSGSHHSA